MFTMLVKTEARLLLRSPALVIWTVIVPLTALVVMAAVPGARRPLAPFGGVSVLQAYQPTLIVFATTMLGLQMLPVLLGGYRELGYLRRLRTTPVSPWRLIAAELVVMAVVALLVSLVMTLVPRLVGVGTWGRVPLVLLVAALTAAVFLALGCALAAVISNSRVAGGAGAALAAIMWFCAGMWLPRAAFPGWLAHLAAWTPGGAAATAMSDATLGQGLSMQAVCCLVGWTALALVVAARAFRWE